MEDECGKCNKEVEIALIGEQMKTFSKAMKDNTELTQQIFDRLCVDSPDGKSQQSQLLILSQKVKWQWGMSALIIASLMGLSMFLIQERIKEPVAKEEPKKVKVSGAREDIDRDKQDITKGPKVALLVD